jgi:O-antigen ligase/polysaccharide polymerase Wzy-like membrane protein
MMSSYSGVLENQPGRPVRSWAIPWLGLCLLSGLAFSVFQSALLIAMLSAGLLFIFYVAVRRRMQIWQAFVLISLTGFIILNYGFENLIVGYVVGIPLVIGEIVMFGGLVLGLRKHWKSAGALFRDPAMKCIVVLWILACIHLISDYPRFGLYAFRDASVFFEAIFLLAGFLWTREEHSIKMLDQWLLFLFIINLVYSSTLPFGDTLQEHSPASGVFQPVALLGQYQHNSLYVVAGAFFCVWMARYVFSWKRWLVILLATEQLATLAILETRSMYIGIVVVAVLMVLLGERRKFTQFLPVLGYGVAAMALFVLATSALGIHVKGRVMDLSGKSLEQHALSLFAVTDEQNRLGQDEDRLDWISQVWKNTVADSRTLIFGQGFGKPLIDFERDGVAVRQPHNSTLGVFGRLGALGLCVWLLFHGLLLARFVRVIRKSREVHSETREFVVWLFAFYVLALILSLVQPTLEFSHCAVPLYFLLGVGLGIMRPALSKETVSGVSRSVNPQLAM